MSQIMGMLTRNKQNNNTSNNNNNNNNTNNNNNNSNNNNTTNGPANDAKNNKKNWLHGPDALVNGHVVYLVKFFGNLPVDQAKGIDVVKDAIRKLQFAQEMKKAETGTQEKCKKVEITISVDGVAVQEPRTQKILHQFPLHNISYCADEKGVKKFFSFIAKTPVGSGGSLNSSGESFTHGLDNGNSSTSEDMHECFVFISNKLASDITLTIGQAFDLAYKKYISSTEKTDLGKAQQEIVDLQKLITIYKSRLRELAAKLPKPELDSLLYKMSIKDILDVGHNDSGTMVTNGNMVLNLSNDQKPLIDTNLNHQQTKMSSTMNTNSSFVPMVPPRNSIPNQNSNKSNSQKMDELLLNSDSDSDFDPRAEELNALSSTINSSSSTNSSSNAVKNNNTDLFGFEPLKTNGQQQQQLLHNHFTNEMHAVTPPLLAPPPKVNATRRTTSVSSGNNNCSLTDGHRDLFDSDPFEVNGSSSAFKQISVDDFSLESLDPLRK